ncbi:MAG: hypothetical protein JXA94_03325 [Parachlamydiales bacterium]|nr:hypothetical protein [Parachlamydiales bacterium]
MAARVGGQVPTKELNPFEEAGTLLEELMQDRRAARVHQAAVKTLKKPHERENVNTQTGRLFSEERTSLLVLRQRAAFNKVEDTRI